MAILRDWIEQMAEGEAIEAIVLGPLPWGDYGAEKIPPNWPQNQILTWEQALPWISYEFDDGFGFPGCHAIVAWTTTKIILVSQYDGATEPFVIPRHPTAHEPIMPGHS